MRRLYVLLGVLTLLVTTSAIPAIAQDYYEENYVLHYSGGGSMVEYMELDTSQLNELLISENFEPLSDNIILYGLDFFSQTEDNLRYSFFGATGKNYSDKNGKYVGLSLSNWGIWLEQVFSLTDIAAVSVGGSTSLGKMRLELTHDETGDFQKGISNPYQTLYEAPFFMIKPQVGVNLSLKRYMDLEIKTGYYYSHLLNDWSGGNDSITGHQPMEEMHGPSILFNLNFGF